MQIDCDLQPVLMHPIQKFFRIREKLLIECISGPSSSVTLLYIGNMPINIQNTYRKRNVSLKEIFNDFLVFISCVSVVSAPPVSQSIARQHRYFTGQTEKIAQAVKMMLTICKKIRIFYTVRSFIYPTVFTKYR